jgi:hypothetical protein
MAIVFSRLENSKEKTKRKARVEPQPGNRSLTPETVAAFPD